MNTEPGYGRQPITHGSADIAEREFQFHQVFPQHLTYLTYRIQNAKISETARQEVKLVMDKLRTAVHFYRNYDKRALKDIPVRVFPAAWAPQHLKKALHEFTLLPGDIPNTSLTSAQVYAPAVLDNEHTIAVYLFLSDVSQKECLDVLRQSEERGLCRVV